jgi:hypothetical protein
MATVLRLNAACIVRRALAATLPSRRRPRATLSLHRLRAFRAPTSSPARVASRPRLQAAHCCTPCLQLPLPAACRRVDVSVTLAGCACVCAACDVALLCAPRRADGTFSATFITTIGIDFKINTIKLGDRTVCAARNDGLRRLRRQLSLPVCGCVCPPPAAGQAADLGHCWAGALPHHHQVVLPGRAGGMHACAADLFLWRVCSGLSRHHGLVVVGERRAFFLCMISPIGRRSTRWRRGLKTSKRWAERDDLRRCRATSPCRGCCAERGQARQQDSDWQQVRHGVSSGSSILHCRCVTACVPRKVVLTSAATTCRRCPVRKERH